MLALLASRAAVGQAGGPLAGSTTRAAMPAAAVAGAPIVTILSAAAGALVLSQGAGNASVNLGSVSYFKGTSAAGETSQKNTGSFVISTRFAIRVDCPGSPNLAQVNVTMSRLDEAPSHTIAIDGTALGSAPQTLAPSVPCGSVGEHRLDVAVPVSTPAGSIGSNVAFVATLKK
jgi:hypothetical protein